MNFSHSRFKTMWFPARQYFEYLGLDSIEFSRVLSGRVFDTDSYRASSIPVRNSTLYPSVVILCPAKPTPEKRRTTDVVAACAVWLREEWQAFSENHPVFIEKSPDLFANFPQGVREFASSNPADRVVFFLRPFNGEA